LTSADIVVAQKLKMMAISFNRSTMFWKFPTTACPRRTEIAQHDRLFSRAGGIENVGDRYGRADGTQSGPYKTNCMIWLTAVCCTLKD